jgi:putative oxidoreductase
MSDMLDRTAVSANAIVLLIARILLSAIFLISGFNKLTHLGTTSTNFADRYHLPAAFALAVVAGLVELLGGLLVLVGFKTRWASLLLAAFTLIAAFIGHRYWSVPADQYANQMAHFMKDIAIVGGFLALFAAGAGAISIDRR